MATASLKSANSGTLGFHSGLGVRVWPVAQIGAGIEIEIITFSPWLAADATTRSSGPQA